MIYETGCISRDNFLIIVSQTDMLLNYNKGRVIPYDIFTEQD
jgi:hypothetical protein